VVTKAGLTVEMAVNLKADTPVYRCISYNTVYIISTMTCTDILYFFIKKKRKKKELIKGSG
jgi:hypothetical protein